MEYVPAGWRPKALPACQAHPVCTWRGSVIGYSHSRLNEELVPTRSTDLSLTIVKLQGYAKAFPHEACSECPCSNCDSGTNISLCMTFHLTRLSILRHSDDASVRASFVAIG